MFPRFFKSKLFLISELCLIGLIVVSFVNITKKKQVLEEEVIGLEEQAESVNAENTVLAKRLQRAESNSYVELEAKRKLNYKRKDESVFIFYEDTSVKKEESVKIDNGQEQFYISNPARWFHYFFPY